MRIETKTSCDIVGLHIKRNQAHDGREAFVDLEIGIKKENASDFGEDFGDLAFSSMRERTNEEGVTVVVHLQDNIKPSKKRVIYERHVIVLNGAKLSEQPELLNIETKDGEERVVAKYRVPISTSETKLLSALMGKVGDTTDIEFNPEQQLLELREKPEKSA